MLNHIIVALGNPEAQHEKSRHNAGWLAVDHYIKKINWKKENKFNALIAKENDILFVKPLTYMNLSGDSVYKIMNYYKLLPKKYGLILKKDSNLIDILTIIHDDIDIDLGKYKIASNSSSAGHRGIQSIINRLRTKKFNRLRLGIKTPLLRQIIPADKFVLQKFSQEELNILFSTVDKAWPEIIKAS
jgi:peptidyl-tRNA hydrolase, PTH1 family